MKRLLNELGIFLCILVVFAAVVVVAFRDKVPFDAVVPVADEYVSEKNEYVVSSKDRLSSVQEKTVRFKTEKSDIVAAENEVRIGTGKATPFGQISGRTDLPTELVGEEKPVDNNKSVTVEKQGASGPEGVIQDMEDAENESAKDRFERRTQQN